MKKEQRENIDIKYLPFNKAENGGNTGGHRVCAAHCKSSKKIQFLIR
jgi:hypothetical protein